MCCCWVHLACLCNNKPTLLSIAIVCHLYLSIMYCIVTRPRMCVLKFCALCNQNSNTIKIPGGSRMTTHSFLTESHQYWCKMANLESHYFLWVLGCERRHTMTQLGCKQLAVHWFYWTVTDGPQVDYRGYSHPAEAQRRKQPPQPSADITAQAPPPSQHQSVPVWWCGWGAIRDFSVIRKQTMANGTSLWLQSQLINNFNKINTRFFSVLLINFYLNRVCWLPSLIRQ